MSDDELAEYLGIAGKVGCAEIMANITPERRAVYESMADTEFALKLWQDGVGPKPEGVIICHEHKQRRSRSASDGGER